MKRVAPLMIADDAEPYIHRSSSPKGSIQKRRVSYALGGGAHLQILDPASGSE